MNQAAALVGGFSPDICSFLASGLKPSPMERALAHLIDAGSTGMQATKKLQRYGFLLVCYA